MADFVEKLGHYIEKQVEKKPKYARELLLNAYRAYGLEMKLLPKKQLTEAKRYLTLISGQAIIRPLKSPEKQVLTSIFTPCEMMHAMDLYPMCAEQYATYTNGAGAEHAFVEAAEREGISETFCSYHKVVMGAAAAGLLKRVHETVEAAAEPDEEPGLTAATPQAALALAMPRLTKPSRQELCLISVDAQGAPRRCEAMPWDAFTPAAVKALVRSALDCGDDRLILVWKRLGRPRGLSPAEQADVGALLSALSRMDIYLCDLMLVHEGAVIAACEVVGATAATHQIWLTEPAPGQISANDLLYPGEGGNCVDGPCAVYGTLFFGKDAFGVVDPEGMGMEMIIKDASQIGGPLNQFSTVGYKFESAAKILYQNRMVRVESCSAYSGTDEAN